MVNILTIVIKFASLLSYLPKYRWPISKSQSELNELSQALEYMNALKQDQIQPGGCDRLTHRVAEWCAQRSIFSRLFLDNITLVPMPSSKKTRSDTLWVPLMLAKSLHEVGLGKEVVCCLSRSRPMQKSSASLPMQRPTVEEHCDTLEMTPMIIKPVNILLVDDVVTTGTTFLAAYSMIHNVYPDATINAFAAMRTVLYPDSDSFKSVMEPYGGTIRPAGSHAYRSGASIISYLDDCFM